MAGFLSYCLLQFIYAIPWDILQITTMLRPSFGEENLNLEKTFGADLGKYLIPMEIQCPLTNVQWPLP